MIEGDNLEVLKLLQKSYAGKVKLIYIDPPYNTGKDFVYPDSFQDNIQNYLELTGQADGEGRKLTSNTEASGRFHTDWLNMMYPRLRLARALLRDDGAMFITIDDGELPNLVCLCNEIFGEENHVATICWQKKVSPSNDAKWFSTDHDSIVLFAKSRETWRPYRLPMNDRQKGYYTNPDNDERGPWNSATYTCNKSKDERPNLYYAIKNPNTGEEVWPKDTAVWAYSRDLHASHVKENLLYWGSDGRSKMPRLKKFLTEAGNVVPRSIWFYDDVGHTQEATKELMSLFPESGFDTPKPTRLIKRMLQIAVEPNKGDIVLDFFAGSGTTGQAVLDMNHEDGGNRRFILVQLPEPTGRKDYGTISDITKERLRRASKKLKAAEKGKLSIGVTLDCGFRVFGLDSSNIRAWDANRDNMADTLAKHAEHLKADRAEQDILFELLLKLGLDLTVPIEKRLISGKTVHSIGAGALMVCLAEKIAGKDVEPLALGVVEWHKKLAPAGETAVVFRDSAFADDVAKTNLTAILQQHGLENVRSI
jgi:adenine-specific DNA-methyltransferase